MHRDLHRWLASFRDRAQEDLDTLTAADTAMDTRMDAAEAAIDVLEAKAITQGQLITGVTLEPWVDNSVAHTLGRTPNGFVVVKRNYVANKAHGYRSSGVYSLGPGAWTQIPLNSEEYDEGNNFDATTGSYECPVDGDYEIHLGGRIEGLAAGSIYGMALSIDGALPTTSMGYMYGQGMLICSGSTRLRLNEGQTVAMVAWNGDSGAANRNVRFEENRMVVHVVDDGVQDNQAANPSPTTSIYLRVSYTQTVDLWVF